MEKELHRKLAVELFNLTWDLMDKQDRTEEEADRMLHAAHASRFHWGEIGTPLEYERGEWQISRVYAILERSEPAFFHATRCLEICRAHDIGDFDLAFAYEGLARALVTAGDVSEAGKNIELGRNAGSAINKAEDREYFFQELDAVSEMIETV